MTQPPSAERLWQLTVEHSPVGMTLVRPDGILLSANRALCSMLGFTEDELQGRRFQTLTHPDDLPTHLRLYDETIAGVRSSYRLTKRCVRSDGSTLWGDLSVAVLRDDDGTPLHLIGQIVDVTALREDRERLAAAVELVEHQRRMGQAILDTVDLGLLLIDREGHYEEWNRRHRDFLSLAYPEGHHGRAGQLGEVYAADGTTRVAHDDMPTARAARGEEFDDYRIWVGADPSARRALSVSARSVRDPSGGFAGAVLGYGDVTDLMRAVQSRDDFLAAVSHELRTPLTSVLGHLELLADRGDLLDDVTRQLQVVRRNSLRLQHLVADLLLSAQHREGNPVLSRAASDLSDLLRDAVESATPVAAAQGVELVVDLPPSLPTVIDHERIRQVVDNLVSNAVKYTDAGGRVELRLRATGPEVEIAVSDTGMGIDADDLDRVFTPFFRSQEARERVTPGVGLGLGIAKSIVAAHGGRIEISSAPADGTTVRVLLPSTWPDPPSL
ncbi:cell wall metabolism sensor histidine kinase WalK [Nocardioides sp.]|uniref:sensor histidine kinase n=1 Tax=Nocardioides sp. TaxID=35761 RepID=UPI00271CB6DB|nr:ATP-binding protein [Nocardioides sp.]MDO9458491.1 PAS domain S-box protein [Nocardioides sp.]